MYIQNIPLYIYTHTHFFVWNIQLSLLVVPDRLDMAFNAQQCQQLMCSCIAVFALSQHLVVYSCICVSTCTVVLFVVYVLLICCFVLLECLFVVLFILYVVYLFVCCLFVCVLFVLSVVYLFIWCLFCCLIVFYLFCMLVFQHKTSYLVYPVSQTRRISFVCCCLYVVVFMVVLLLLLLYSLFCCCCCYFSFVVCALLFLFAGMLSFDHMHVFCQIGYRMCCCVVLLKYHQVLPCARIKLLFVYVFHVCVCVLFCQNVFVVSHVFVSLEQVLYDIVVLFANKPKTFRK